MVKESIKNALRLGKKKRQGVSKEEIQGMQERLKKEFPGADFIVFDMIQGRVYTVENLVNDLQRLMATEGHA